MLQSVSSKQKWRQVIEFHSEYRLVLLVFSGLAGLSYYFTSDSEPSLLLTGGFFSFFAVLSLYFYLRQANRFRFIVLVGVFFCGFATYGQIYTLLSGVVLLSEPVNLNVENAELLAANPRPDGSSRLILKFGEETAGLVKGSKVRIRHLKALNAEVGDIINVRIRLEPLPGAVRPGGFDFRRQGYFQGLSAVGYSLSAVTVVQDMSANAGFLHQLRIKFKSFRRELGQKLYDHIDGQAGALAAALTVGERGYLSNETQSALRDAGLAHLLAISGLHMGLVAGASFFLFEGLIALFPAIALRIVPARLAAVGAIAVSLGYLFLSGATVSSQRAFIMIVVGLIAVIVNRRALSLRSVALAGLVIMFFSPYAVVQAGFQMSFVATTALVLMYERMGAAAREDVAPAPNSWWEKGKQGVLTSLAITLLTQLAVGPVALYHFQALSIIALFANLLAVPIVAFFVMPLLAITILLYMFSVIILTAPILSFALDIILATSKYLSSLEGGVIRISAPETIAFGFAMAVFSMAILFKFNPFALRWDTVNNRRFQFVWVTVFSTVATLIVVMHAGRPPIAMLSGARPSVMAVSQDGSISTWGVRKQGFQMDNWLRAMGNSNKDEFGSIKRVCDADGCMFHSRPDLILAKPNTVPAYQQDCRSAHIVVVPDHLRDQNLDPQACSAQSVTSSDLVKYGPVAVFQMADGQLSLEYSSKPPARPWHPGYAG